MEIPEDDYKKLIYRISLLEQQNNNDLHARSFMKRALAVWGYSFAGGIFIYLGLVVVAVILRAVFGF